MRSCTQSEHLQRREAIQKAFLAAEGPISSEEVLIIARRRFNRLALATVYRYIRSLVKEQWLSVVDIPGTCARYVVSEKSPHGYFYCMYCHGLHALKNCQMPNGVELPDGVTITNYSVIIHGYCGTCGSQMSPCP